MASVVHRRIPHTGRKYRRRENAKGGVFAYGLASFRSLVRELCRDEGHRMQDLIQPRPAPPAWPAFKFTPDFTRRKD
jgi:hypothetical protein